MALPDNTNTSFATAWQLDDDRGALPASTVSVPPDQYGERVLWFKYTVTRADGYFDITIKPISATGQVMYAVLYRTSSLTDNIGEASAGSWWKELSGNPGPGEAYRVVGKNSYAAQLHIAVYMVNPDDGAFTFAWNEYLSQVIAVQPGDLGTAYVDADAHLGEGAVYNADAGEIWALTYDVPKVIARFNPATSMLVGYAEYTVAAKWPIVYDPFSKLVWASGGGYTAWDSRTHEFVTHIAASDQLVWNVSPYDGVLWSGVEASGNNNKLRRYDKMAGTSTDYVVGASIVQIEFTPNGDVWYLNFPADAYGYRLVRFQPLTGVSTPYPIPGDQDPGDDLIQIVADPDRNSIWANIQDFGGIANGGNYLREFRLDTLTWAPDTDIIAVPYMGYQYGYQPVSYDPYRKAIVYASDMEGTVTLYSTTDGSIISSTFIDDYTVTDTTASPEGAWVINNGYGGLFKIGNAPIPDEGIINDRDVWLQTFAERFEKPTIQNGTEVNLAQFGDTGVLIASAKSLALSASSQTFLVNNMMVEPPWITLTPTLRNLTGTPTYSVVAGSATLSVVQDKCQVLFGGMGSNKVTVRATLTTGGVTYMDQVSLVKLTTGGTAVTTLLTNEMQSVFADSYGNVLSYMGASGSFRLWEGAFEITGDATFSVLANPQNLLVSITNLGQFTVYGMPSTVPSGTVTFRATYHGATYDEVFTITKIVAPTGSAADPSTKSVGGQRLPVRLNVPVTAVIWNDITANDAVAPYGGPVLNDVITQYNNVPNPQFKETRFWVGNKWQVLYALIDGNLLVAGSIGADALSANAIDAVTGNFQTLVTDSLTATKAEIDTLIADSITAAKAEITDLIATNIDAVNGNFDNLTINGTQIDPNSINTGHVINNAISVPATMSGNGAVTVSGAGFSADYSVGTVAYASAASIISSVTVSVTGGGGPGAGGAVFYEIHVLKNDVSVAAGTFTAPAAQITSATFSPTLSVDAGTYTWKFRVTISNGGGEISITNYGASFIGVMK